MLNSNVLLSKKRERAKSIAKSISHNNHNKDTLITEINGFSVIELYYTESLENNNLEEENEIISINESNNELKQNNIKAKEILTRARLKDIEEHYISQNGISEINENCFKCLMTNFLSNELLYFCTKNNLFDYFKYCFINKRKKLFMDKAIYEQNKQQFFSVSPNFLNYWNFFIPKTICKSCFMQLINRKDILYEIKNMFTDTDINSSCKTNYQNYVKFSKSFRKAFSIGPKENKINKEKIHNINRLNEKIKLETIVLSSSDTIEINKSLKKKSKEKRKFNKEVKYDKINQIIYINKTILNDKNYINDENSPKYKIIDNDSIINENNTNNKNYNPTINNIINFQGQNYINIINQININSDNSINNTNLFANNIELIIDKMNNINNVIFGLKQYNIIYQNLYDSMSIITSYTARIFNKLFVLFIYKSLLKNTNLLQCYNCLFYNFQDKYTYFNSQIYNMKEIIGNAINFIDDIYFNINNSIFVNENEKKELLLKISNVKFYLNQNLIFFEEHNKLIKNFIENLYCLIKLIYEMIDQNK